MWNRACPLCFAKVPRGPILTGGEEVICPHCRAPLQLSTASRALAAVCGLAAGFLAVRLIVAANPAGAWAWQVIGAVLAYTTGASAALYAFSDLVVRQNPPAKPGPQGPNLPQAEK